MNKTLVVLALAASTALAEPTAQLPIDRVDLMPNNPTPFKLKDFKTTARDFQKLVFNFDAQGEYQPLIWWDDTQVNLPIRTFGLPSYVGNNQKRGGDDHEAITTIGPVLGSTVAGIDMSAGEHNWVDMCSAYFNTKTGQFVVLNNISTTSGKTYWYETFPQILFNALVDRYPNWSRGEEIMRTAADRWNDAYKALAATRGGLNFDHTAFDLVAMKPVDNGKWHEPDGAAGIAYIQYSAYKKFGDKKYLDAADALIGYLEGRATSPLYEIDLPFGALVAARLNAEDGGNHDVGRLLNWCFNPSDTRSGWGVIVGRWGDYDVSGLAGSVSDGGGYGFVMNTYAMGGAIVPIARYDERYARSIGKWMLNAMNAVRLCYQDEIPRELQSCPDWKSEPAHVIPYEGIRKQRNGKSPYASGDPLVAGWGKTDLGLYGGGFVGFFGGMISATNEEMIPRIDLLATDFFRDRAQPTYLFYNPHDDRREVRIFSEINGLFDLYDAVRNDFVARNMKAVDLKVAIEPDSAAVIVVVPSNAKITHDGRKTPKQPPKRDDKSRAVAADTAKISVDGDPSDWASVASERLHVTTADRGTLEADVRFAWDLQYLYVLVEQRTPARRVHEAPDAEKYAAAPWDFDGVWLHLDLANDTLPSIGDVICSMAFSSNNARNIVHAPALSGVDGAELEVATSGTAQANNRVIEAKIAWKGLVNHAFNGRQKLVDQFGGVRFGVRVGCEVSILEFNHTGQAFIGGAQYRKPTGFDENSRDILLRTGKPE
jgi:hypothetical protein